MMKYVLRMILVIISLALFINTRSDGAVSQIIGIAGDNTVPPFTCSGNLVHSASINYTFSPTSTGYRGLAILPSANRYYQFWTSAGPILNVASGIYNPLTAPDKQTSFTMPNANTSAIIVTAINSANVVKAIYNYSAQFARGVTFTSDLSSVTTINYNGAQDSFSAIFNNVVRPGTTDLYSMNADQANLNQVSTARYPLTGVSDILGPPKPPLLSPGEIAEINNDNTLLYNAKYSNANSIDFGDKANCFIRHNFITRTLNAINFDLNGRCAAGMVYVPADSTIYMVNSPGVGTYRMMSMSTSTHTVLSDVAITLSGTIGDNPLFFDAVAQKLYVTSIVNGSNMKVFRINKSTFALEQTATGTQALAASSQIHWSGYDSVNHFIVGGEGVTATSNGVSVFNICG